MTPTSRNTSILVVDDNPDNLGVLFELLSEHGFQVLIANDGESALMQAEYAHPDLILLDILLPGSDGFAICRKLKTRQPTHDIPVIFMSALSETGEKVRGFQLGAVDYITKPFQHDEVLARVTTHITLQQLKERLRESEERLSNIVESAMDAIVTLDQQGCVTLFNHAAERVFRCSAREVLGRPFAPLMTDGLRRVIADYMRGSGKGSGSPAIWVPESESAVRADGEVFPIEASLSRAEAAGQALYTIILRDVAERRRAEAEHQQLQGLTLYLQNELRAERGVEEVIGAAQGLREVMQGVRQVAATDASVLITGETGTGKEVIARAIHALSTRKDKVLVTLNCAAIPSGLVESELFGHEKGAFTGAVARKPGRFELADGGTLFLDEIGELSLDLQAKLLRVLQEGEFERVGGTRTLRVDVRIIAATNRDLAQCTRDGTFRADLFYRLNVFPLALPLLRERREDIPALVEYFARRYAARYGKRIERVPARTLSVLKAYDWPGNVRELQHVVERAVILARGPELDLPSGLQQTTSAPPVPSKVPTLEEVERAHIIKVLEDTGWRVSGRTGAAELLGLPPTTLESRMKKLGIRRPHPQP
jgi:PAS domain S-box-containing protein